jgi:molybdate/tungstate transport system substrate-binding protein
MAIAYTPKSKFAKDINASNWTDILIKDGVKVGHSNPNIDPCGYRSILVTKLAQKYYNKPDFYNQLLGYKEYYKNGDENKNKIIVRPKETDLLALLEIGAIDYLFIYKSVAKQHKLNYIEIPPKISLKSNQYNNYYQQVGFKISGKKPGEFILKKGSAMIYGITIIQNHKSPQNKQGAIAFIKYLLSKDAQKIIQQNGQTPINPPIITGDDSILREK